MIWYLRILGNIEGVSYLLLLGIAMPMKYLLDMPMAVKIVGMAHGVLFLAYCLLLAICMKNFKWKFGFGLYLFMPPFPSVLSTVKLNFPIQRQQTGDPPELSQRSILFVPGLA